MVERKSSVAPVNPGTPVVFVCKNVLNLSSLRAISYLTFKVVLTEKLGGRDFEYFSVANSMEDLYILLTLHQR